MKGLLCISVLSIAWILELHCLLFSNVFGHVKVYIYPVDSCVARDTVKLGVSITVRREAFQLT